MPGGRPTAYDPTYAEQAEKLCLLAATSADLADFFGVSIRTVERWAARHEEFRRALKVGKEAADQRVERSLFQRAVGYTFDGVKVFNNKGVIVTAKVREHVPPDTTAQIFWLKNRKSAEWRDRQLHEHSGPEGAPMQVESDSMTDVAKLLLAALHKAG